MKDLLKEYFGIGFTNKEIFAHLAHQHRMISIQTKSCIYKGERGTLILFEIVSFVESEIATSGGLHGSTDDYTCLLFCVSGDNEDSN